MFLMKWKEIFMIVWVFQRISTVIQEFFQEEVQLKWKFLQESMKKQVNMRELNNCPSEQVLFSSNLVGYAL